MVQTVTEQDLILNLKAAGFEETALQAFLAVWKDGKTEDQRRLLSQKRQGLLDQIHREEKQIRSLDDLACRLRKQPSC